MLRVIGTENWPILRIAKSRWLRPGLGFDTGLVREVPLAEAWPSRVQVARGRLVTPSHFTFETFHLT